MSSCLLGMLNIDVRRRKLMRNWFYFGLLGMLNIDVRRPAIQCIATKLCLLGMLNIDVRRLVVAVVGYVMVFVRLILSA